VPGGAGSAPRIGADQTPSAHSGLPRVRVGPLMPHMALGLPRARVGQPKH